jgi:uncharacterized repeat protein (TIGR03803 family)
MQAHTANNLTCRLFVGIAVAMNMVAGFAMPTSAATETVVYAFQNNSGDGANPVAGLINVGGTFYGTTAAGGRSGEGAIYSINAKSGFETLLYSFCSQPACADGSTPMAGLVSVGGVLYGTTESGGKNTTCRDGCGTIFSFSPKTGETAVYQFQGASTSVGDGANPMAGLIDVDGTLYGTTYDGGDPTACNGGCGTVFSFVPKTGVESVIYTFEGANNSDGSNPTAGLIYVDHLFYGTTEYGGANDYGMVFSTDTSGDETDLYDFQDSGDGAYPEAGLIDVGGTLYGTTYSGGTGDSGAGDTGTVFSLGISSDTETVVYSFCSLSSCSDGSNPVAGLIDLGGSLYGTTQGGGPDHGDGTVFSIKPKTGAETIVYSFCQTSCSDGEEPVAGLIDVGGTLYGTTEYGGTPGKGTVFAISKP